MVQNIYLGAVPIFCIAFFVTILSASVLAPVDTSKAADIVITTNVSHTAYSLSFSVTPNVTFDMMPDVDGVMSVDSTHITAGTSAPLGYKVYLGMDSPTNDLIHDSDDSLRISAVDGTFSSAAALSDNGTWGYALSNEVSTIASPNDFDDLYYIGSNFTPNSNKFAAVPTNSDPAQLIAGTYEANFENDDDFDVYYGLRANYATAVGIYANKIRYTAVADAGVDHNVYVSPEKTSETSGGEMLDITASLFAVPSEFAANVYLLTPVELEAVHNGADISTFAGKQLTCTRDLTAQTLHLVCTSLPAALGNYYLYVDVPMYEESYEIAFNYVEQSSSGVIVMQNMTSEICSSLPTGELKSAKDSRDDNVYNVKKLQDGHWWMVDNLRLAKSMTLTSADSNVVSDYELTKKSGSDAIGDGDAYDSGNSLYGAYYTWNTAIADSYVDDYHAPLNSICPRGWRLVRHDDLSAEAGGIFNYYSTNAALMDSFNGLGYVLSGVYRNGEIVNTNVEGLYWLAGSIYSDQSGSILQLYPPDAPGTSFANWSYGLPIRCLFDTGD